MPGVDLMPLAQIRHRAAMAGSNPNLKLLPELATRLGASAAALDLTTAALVAILVRNDSIQPARLAALQPAAGEKLSRVVVACHMRTEISRLATRGARRCRLTRNAYLEALIDRHLAGDGRLFVLPTAP